MARIPDHELERIKAEILVEALAREAGVSLKAHGDDLIGLCRFHDDHEPSLVVTPARNLWHCLGACQAGGSVIDWVMKANGVSFRHAAEILRARLGFSAAVLQTAAGPSPKKGTTPKLASPFEPDADERELMRQVVDFYAATLKESPAALDYLTERGLHSAEMIDRFRLGYANRTLGYRLPFTNRKEGAAIRSRLQRLGIVRESGHEHFNGSIVVPIFDEEGTVTEMYGRKVTRGLRPGTPDHLYLPGPHRGVWNIEAFAASNEIILCEALFDAMTFWVHGLRNVTTSCGVEGFTPDHLAAFKRHGVTTVHIAYDRDEAGDGAAAKLAERLMAEGIACYRVLFPKGMDANEYALMVQPAERSLDLAVRSSVWIGNGRAPAQSTIVLSGETTALVLPAAEAAIAAHPPATERPEAAAKEKNVSEPRGSTLRLVDMPIELTDDEAVFRIEDRRYRVRGLAKCSSFGALRLNLYVSREGISFEGTPLAGFHVDTFDLYVSRPRGLFAKQAAAELGVKEEAIRRDLGFLVRGVERVQEERVRGALAPKAQASAMGDEERADALELLSDPNLLDRIVADFEKCGVIGEETNKLAIYLAALTRKLDAPLAVVIQSSSAAGKSRLMDAVLDFVPPEEREKYAAMSGQSLFYFNPTTKSLKHKILAISEEEGAETASYALKILQSEGELTIASTGKDATSGRLETKEYHVEGPVMILLTTTAIEIDEELLNRCLVLTVDESREQTRAIHRYQRERRTLAGLWASEAKTRVTRLHQDAQRLLRPLRVVNPFSSRLTFLADKTRTRRDHVKYLTFIDAIALLHQYQRPIKTDRRGDVSIDYIEVEPSDIAVANRLANEILGRCLDELPPQTRRFLNLLDEMVRHDCARLGLAREDHWFRQKDVRDATGWSDIQVRTHLARLVALEYALVHRGARGQSFVYELLYNGEGEDGRAFVMGLIDPETLRVQPESLAEGSESVTTIGTPRGETGGSEGSPRRHRGAVEGVPSDAEIDQDVNLDGAIFVTTPSISENSRIRVVREIVSYSKPRRNSGKRAAAASGAGAAVAEPAAPAPVAPAALADDDDE